MFLTDRQLFSTKFVDYRNGLSPDPGSSGTSQVQRQRKERDMIDFEILAVLPGRSVLGNDRPGALSRPNCRM